MHHPWQLTMLASTLATCLTVAPHASRAQAAPTAAGPQPVRLFAEAEDFKIVKGDWQVVRYRENYYASTFALTFLSRLGCLGAPEQVATGQEAVAEQAITIPTAGTYQILVRYEQPYNFSAEFDLEIEQGGKVVARRPFGRLDQVRIWGCSGSIEARRAPMQRFFWGATDNIVWQQQPEPVTLAAGPATLRLIAGPQMDGIAPRQQAVRRQAARRHVDLVCLTTDEVGLEAQRKHGSTRTYLENDGWLTQAGDLYLRVTVPKDAPGPVVPVIAPNMAGQHSPYWVHLRDWPTTRVLKAGIVVSPLRYALAGPRAVAVKAELLAPVLDPEPYVKAVPPEAQLQPGDTSGWAPVGQVLDALHNYIWNFDAGKDRKLDLEFAVPDGKGGLRSVRKLTVSGSTAFEMPGCVAPNPVLLKQMEAAGMPPVIRTVPEALDWLLGEVKKFPDKGPTAKRFLIYAIMGFGSGLQYESGRQLALALGDNTAVGQQGKKRNLVAHWRETSIADIQAREAKTPFDDLYIVSYGDETHLPAMEPKPEEFAAWLQAKGVKTDGPPTYTTKREDPLYYYSQICAKEKGANLYAGATAYYASKGALTGANYSPHGNYLVTEIDYIRPFKLKAMSMPWSEDYVWQVPEMSVQVMGYITSAFRAGAKYHQNPIHMYVMPHSPGNTPRDFRLSFYTCVAHGTKMVNYFCAGPLAVGGTENYVATDDLPMWRAVHAVSHEAGVFEDYVMDGAVRPAKVGLLLSSVDELLGGYNNARLAMHNNERKAIYYALRHAQVPVDMLSEDDVIDGLAKDYQVIYVTQKALHSKAVAALTAWAQAGGTVVALCGGGFTDEFGRDNPAAHALYGVGAQQIDTDPNVIPALKDGSTTFLSKQDLPPYVPFDAVTWDSGAGKVEGVGVIMWKQTLAATDGQVIGTFKDGKPAAVAKTHGKGRAVLFGFLPGQAYLKSGLPLRPADRGSTDAAYAHFLPTDMDPKLRAALVDAFLPAGFVRPVECSEPLVETTCIDTTKPAARLAVPLINYTGKPIAELTVKLVGVAKPKKIRAVEGTLTKVEATNLGLTVTLPLDVADVLLIDR